MPALRSRTRSRGSADRVHSRRRRSPRSTAIAPDRASAETEFFSWAEYGRERRAGQPGAARNMVNLLKEDENPVPRHCNYGGCRTGPYRPPNIDDSMEG